MALSRELSKRSESKCELCGSNHEVDTYNVPPKDDGDVKHQVALCAQCESQVTADTKLDHNHWRCLNDSMWSQEPPVQVMAYRMLHSLKSETDWAGDLLDMMYLDDDIKSWAEAGLPDEDALVYKDANGVVLSAGDSVVLIQDLNVKGSSLTAKRGAAVRRIRLDPNDANYIEGKVDGQTVMILTKYVKKTN